MNDHIRREMWTAYPLRRGDARCEGASVYTGSRLESEPFQCRAWGVARIGGQALCEQHGVREFSRRLRLALSLRGRPRAQVVLAEESV